MTSPRVPGTTIPALVGRHARDLLRFATVLGGDAELGERLARQTLARSSDDPHPDPDAWLADCRVRTVRGYLSQDFVLGAPVARTVDDPVDPSAALATQATRADPDGRDLAARVALSSRLQRCLIVLHYREHLSLDEIAGVVGSTPAGMTLYRREVLARLDVADGPSTARAHTEQQLRRLLGRLDAHDDAATETRLDRVCSVVPGARRPAQADAGVEAEQLTAELDLAFALSSAPDPEPVAGLADHEVPLTQRDGASVVVLRRPQPDLGLRDALVTCERLMRRSRARYPRSRPELGEALLAVLAASQDTLARLDGGGDAAELTAALRGTVDDAARRIAAAGDAESKYERNERAEIIAEHVAEAVASDRRDEALDRVVGRNWTALGAVEVVAALLAAVPPDGDEQPAHRAAPAESGVFGRRRRRGHGLVARPA